MPRFFQCLLIVSALCLAWLLMQAVHELGHVVGAWATGGKVQRVVLHPFAISRTDVEPNPEPLIVVWGGPLVGVLVPLLLWGIVAAARLPAVRLAKFFAGFCLLANGLYIGVGSFKEVGDAGDMLRYGSPIGALWLFGLLTAPAGMAIWNGLGPHFGIGRNPPAVNIRVAVSCCLALIVVAVLECLLLER